MVTGSGAIRLATPREIQKFAASDITVEQAVNYLIGEGFYLDEKVDHFLVCARVSPKPWLDKEYVTNIIGNPGEYRDGQTNPNAGKIVLEELADVYAKQYVAPHLVLAHYNSAKKVTLVFQELGYNLERVPKQ